LLLAYHVAGRPGWVRVQFMVHYSRPARYAYVKIYSHVRKAAFDTSNAVPAAPGMKKFGIYVRFPTEAAACLI
jgi:hypothetical protein